MGGWICAPSVTMALAERAQHQGQQGPRDHKEPEPAGLLAPGAQTSASRCSPEATPVHVSTRTEDRSDRPACSQQSLCSVLTTATHLADDFF